MGRGNIIWSLLCSSADLTKGYVRTTTYAHLLSVPARCSPQSRSSEGQGGGWYLLSTCPASFPSSLQHPCPRFPSRKRGGTEDEDVCPLPGNSCYSVGMGSPWCHSLGFSHREILRWKHTHGRAELRGDDRMDPSLRPWIKPRLSPHDAFHADAPVNVRMFFPYD